MKSIAKVKMQRRIRNIPSLMHGFRMSGLMRPGLSDKASASRRRIKNRIQAYNRRANRP